MPLFGIGKWKTEAWEGNVVKKEVYDDGDVRFYYVHVELPDGKVEKKKYWDGKLSDSFAVGDRIVKRAGEKKPVKG